MEHLRKHKGELAFLHIGTNRALPAVHSSEGRGNVGTAIVWVASVRDFEKMNSQRIRVHLGWCLGECVSHKVTRACVCYLLV